MLTIWKYPIPDDRNFSIEMPQLAHFLDMQFQNDKLVAWYFVNTDNPLEKRHFRLILTGNEIVDEYGKDIDIFYLKTVVKEFSSIVFPDEPKTYEVWHFVEIIDKSEKT